MTATDPMLASDIRSASLLSGEFLLRSGQVSETYFDKYRFESDPTLLKRVATVMEPLLPNDVEVLAGLELGGVPIATALSLATGIPTAFVRKEAKEYGTCLAVEGLDVGGRRVVLIEDVISTGGAVAEAYNQMQRAEADVLGVVCAIWRGEGAPRINLVPDLSVSAVLSKSDLT